MKTFKQFLTERLAGELTIGRWNGKSAYQSPKFNSMDSDFQWDYDLYHDTSKNMFYALLDDDVPGEWAGEGKTLKDCVKDLLGNVQYQMMTRVLNLRGRSRQTIMTKKLSKRI